MRLVHMLVIGALVAAAAYVYEIKFEATLQAERLARLRTEIRKERDAIATLRAEWAKLDNPARIQGLAQRHLKLKAVDATQIDPFDKLPVRPLETPPQGIDDPIGAIIEQDADTPTGSVAAQTEPR
jgi:cell division protein FtsL